MPVEKRHMNSFYTLKTAGREKQKGKELACQVLRTEFCRARA